MPYAKKKYFASILDGYFSLGFPYDDFEVDVCYNCEKFVIVEECIRCKDKNCDRIFCENCDTYENTVKVQKPGSHYNTTPDTFCKDCHNKLT